jgi:DNA polymerase III psi subunit
MSKILLILSIIVLFAVTALSAQSEIIQFDLGEPKDVQGTVRELKINNHNYLIFTYDATINTDAQITMQVLHDPDCEIKDLEKLLSKTVIKGNKKFEEW